MKTEYKQEIAWVKLMVVRDAGRPEFPKRRIMSSQDIFGLYKQMEGYFTSLDREEFVIIGLDGKNRTMFFNSVSVGSLSASIVHPREVFKMAILGNAASLILCHNHPSGDPTPSPEDIAITKRLVSAGELLGIKVLDHIILGRDSHYSFLESSALFWGRKE